MKRVTLFGLVGLLTLAGACEGMRSDVEVMPNGTATYPAAAPRRPADVIVTEGDITGFPYEELGDISVTLSKNSMFGRDPTERMLEAELQEKAAAIGADAVVRVRYGDVGVSLTSWGSIAAEGRAVRFLN